MLAASLLLLQRLRRQQWFRTQRLREIQLKRLKVLIDYAYRNVRYYRKLFESNAIHPSDIHSLDDLRKIPVSTRLEIQKLPREDITSGEIPSTKFKKIITSGSSGTPLPVYKTRHDEEAHDMIWARTFLEDGRRVWDRSADLKFHLPKPIWFERFGVWRKEVISLAQDTATQLEQLRRAKPDVIRGNPFELVNLAAYAKKNGIFDLNPRLIFTMGSVLDRQSRLLIEETFHGRVFDCYATTEMGTISWECPMHQGEHVNIDTLVFELLEDSENVGEGEPGRVVCTGLYSLGMPFIRYDVGDVAVAREGSCECDRGLPLLESIEGRADDFFVSKDGRMLSPSAIVNEVKLVTGVSQFRLIQQAPTKVRAEIVPDDRYTASSENQIRGILSRLIADDLDLSVVKVTELKHDSSGKIRAMISNFKKEF